MTNPVADASPRPKARITGIVYLFYFLTAILAEVFMKGIVVSGDAAATANNIQAHEPLFRLGLGTGLIATAWYIALDVYKRQVWACAPAEYWIEAALIVGALTLVVLKRKRPASPAR